ncbi:MAG: GMC family oxidoreductase [Gammaproteobacteria bacterium]|nr:GMC family oxidoreductase [Gammaproteobacteria bacterium]
MTDARHYPPDDASVVVVIGSGAGGAVVGRALAERGIDVVCLEAGERLALSDIRTDEAAMFPQLTWLDERIGEGDVVPGFPVWTCKTVGGTTLHWTASCPRLQAHELEARSTYGAVEGTSLVDWPFGLDELAPWYDRAEALMGVAGTGTRPFLPAHNNYKVLEAGARKLGYRNVDTNTVAINAVPRDGRSSCLQLGFCTSGCASGAKWSTLYTEIPTAERTGHFELRSGCMAVGIDTDDNGRANRVHYVDAGGIARAQRARLVCVACNAVDTARLLLASGSDRHPHGLANTSGEVGRNYMRHLLAGVVGVMPGEVHFYKGAHEAGIVRDEARHDPGRGFFGGFLILTQSFTPETVARLMFPGRWGREVTAVLEHYRNFACLLVMGEDPPRPDNRIVLHPRRRDRCGLPLPVVRYRHHPNSIAMRTFALGAGHRIYEALGATGIHDMVDVFPATHNMGTARMGDDPATSVCDRYGRTHDVPNLYVSDGSLFPTAGCENPTLTIVALALRQADFIAGELAGGHV